MLELIKTWKTRVKILIKYMKELFLKKQLEENKDQDLKENFMKYINNRDDDTLLL